MFASSCWIRPGVGTFASATSRMSASYQAPASITRESISRRVDVMFNARGRDAGAVASDVRTAIQGVQFPLEYHAEVLGEYADREGAQQRVAIGGVVAIAAIFLLLQAAFQSWRLATLAIVLLPWGLIGGLIAAALLSSGGMLSIASLLGLLAVLGIGARNLIVTIRHYQRIEADGEPFGPTLVVSGTMDRFGSVLASAVATGLVLLPFAILGGLPGLEVAGPLAIIIIGGLITVALLNLFVVPAAYLRFGRPVMAGPWPVLEPGGVMMQKAIPVIAIAAVLAVMALASTSVAEVSVAADEEWQTEFNVRERPLTDMGEATYFVLVPGFQLVLESGSERVTITVLNETRDVGGITTRVVEERSEVRGELHEIAANFVAMDQETGDVFYFGEEVDYYQDGEVVSHEGAWLAYEDGSLPGLLMPGSPVVGMKYYQEVAPGAAEDRAEVISTTETVSVPARVFQNSLRTREENPLSPARSKRSCMPGAWGSSRRDL